MQPPPATVESLQVALSITDVSGPTIAAWRDHYLEAVAKPEPLVELCVDELHARQLCYSCGQQADTLVDNDFPWVCDSCAARA